MNQIDRKARIRECKDTPRPAGVYRVRNMATGRSLLGAAADLPAKLNGQRFQLDNGLHPDKELQRDWNELGPAAFAFEVLDALESREGPACDPTDDLRVLKEMWLEKLTASGASLYPQSWRGASR